MNLTSEQLELLEEVAEGQKRLFLEIFKEKSCEDKLDLVFYYCIGKLHTCNGLKIAVTGSQFLPSKHFVQKIENAIPECESRGFINKYSVKFNENEIVAFPPNGDLIKGTRADIVVVLNDDISQEILTRIALGCGKLIILPRGVQKNNDEVNE